MTLDEFVEMVTERTGFCVESAELDETGRIVVVRFDVDSDGDSAVTADA